MAHPSIVYKIVDRDAWLAAREQGVFTGAAIDVTDGYIHFSTAAQIHKTADKHFVGQYDLLLVAVNADSLASNLRWEPSRGGDLFPHLYGALKMKSVLWEEPMPIGPDGTHQFPDEIT